MKKVLGLCLAVVFMAGVAGATLIISDMNVAVTEDFDGWDGTSAPANWTLTGNTNPGYQGEGTGSGISGGIWSYGAAGDPDRALGYLGNGSTAQRVDFALALQNDTGADITELIVVFDAEQWRKALSRENTWTLSIDLGAGATPVVYTPSWVSDASGPAGNVDGNSAAFSETLTASITGISIADQDTFSLIWSADRGTGSGSSQGIAIDNISITAIPEPSTIALLALAGGLTLFVRRRKA